MTESNDAISCILCVFCFEIHSLFTTGMSSPTASMWEDLEVEHEDVLKFKIRAMLADDKVVACHHIRPATGGRCNTHLCSA